jgi:hypothetical protein
MRSLLLRLGLLDTHGSLLHTLYGGSHDHFKQIWRDLPVLSGIRNIGANCEP